MNESSESAQSMTACEAFGHVYTIGSDPEVYNQCVSCGEPRDQDNEEAAK